MILRSYCYIFFIFSACNKSASTNNDLNKRNTFYFSVSGDDKNDGSFDHPLKTISYLNTLNLKVGDSVLFKGGETFMGNISLKANTKGNTAEPVLIASYGNGNAIIDAANETAITIYNSSFVNIHNLTCKGTGRKDGNTKAGIAITSCNNIVIDNIDV
ncbi:MAG: hypothetical protein ACRDE5_15145, partial [Ginsengibacter sp.]